MKLSSFAILLVASSASAFAPSAMSVVRPGTSLNAVEVTAKLVKELRDSCGAGMLDCKNALLDNDGDMEAASDQLRKAGLAKADKKASRIAAEGKIMGATEGSKSVVVEVNCETDFVAKDSSFMEFGGKVAKAALSVSGDDIDALMAAEVDGDSIEDTRLAIINKIGENIKVRRMVSVGGADTVTGSYVHMGKIGVLVELEGGSEELAQSVAMHIAAMNPPYAVPEDVPEDVLEKEKKVLTEQALESGKPPEIVEKMVVGRIRKYLEEICLVSQPYVRDSDMTVGAYLKKNGASMLGFKRIAVGEGIEKKQEDFAAEVAKAAGGN